eukprot:Transcript_25361.p4 GENE.Transcript_25361~~Transcript_25361.p4  ORF type:complete len:197 (-),score=19.78 Transcript_25361:500-1090(-)
MVIVGAMEAAVGGWVVVAAGKAAKGEAEIVVVAKAAERRVEASRAVPWVMATVDAVKEEGAISVATTAGAMASGGMLAVAQVRRAGAREAVAMVVEEMVVATQVTAIAAAAMEVAQLDAVSVVEARAWASQAVCGAMAAADEVVVRAEAARAAARAATVRLGEKMVVRVARSVEAKAARSQTAHRPLSSLSRFGKE